MTSPTYVYSSKVRKLSFQMTSGLPGGPGSAVVSINTNLPRPSGETATAWRLHKIDWKQGATYDPAWSDNNPITLFIMLDAYWRVAIGEAGVNVVTWSETINGHLEPTATVTTRFHTMNNREWVAPSRGLDVAADRFECTMQQSPYNEGVMGGQWTGYLDLYYQQVLISYGDFLDARRGGS